MSCSPGGGGPTACESNVPARTAFSRARHLTNREGTTTNGEPEMNPINAPATAGEPGTADVRAIDGDELARVEGGLMVCGALTICWAGGGYLVIPLFC